MMLGVSPNGGVGSSEPAAARPPRAVSGMMYDVLDP